MQRTTGRAGFLVPTALSGVLTLLAIAWFAINAPAPWGPWRATPCWPAAACGWPGADAVSVLRRADVAMYAAKAAGKGRSARYAPEMDLAVAVG
ncbi:MAG: hypothetical protein ABW022_12520 [Actinoplanes sp.]